MVYVQSFGLGRRILHNLIEISSAAWSTTAIHLSLGNSMASTINGSVQCQFHHGLLHPSTIDDVMDSKWIFSTNQPQPHYAHGTGRGINNDLLQPSHVQQISIWLRHRRNTSLLRSVMIRQYMSAEARHTSVYYKPPLTFRNLHRKETKGNYYNP